MLLLLHDSMPRLASANNKNMQDIESFFIQARITKR